jgi:hypothetical protein
LYCCKNCFRAMLIKFIVGSSANVARVITARGVTCGQWRDRTALGQAGRMRAGEQRARDCRSEQVAHDLPAKHGRERRHAGN